MHRVLVTALFAASWIAISGCQSETPPAAEGPPISEDSEGSEGSNVAQSPGNEQESRSTAPEAGQGDQPDPGVEGRGPAVGGDEPAAGGDEPSPRQAE